MPHLTLSLLGSPRIESQDAPVEVDTRKAIALLVYLVITGQRHTRDTLATLLWPDNDQSSARAALRRTLFALRKGLKQDCLEVTRETIGIQPDLDLWVDVAQFRRLLASCAIHGHKSSEVCPACLPQLAEAVSLYRDDFLAGFSLRDSTNFEEWQFFESENLRRELAEALEKLVSGHSRQKDFESAIQYARRWLALDPLREEAHRQLMQLYAWDDQRNAALRQYRECVRILEQELGVPPLEETTQLYQAILENRVSPPPADIREQPERVPGPAEPAVLEPKSRQPGYPLVGRAQHWSALLQAYENRGSEGYFFVLEGEAGIGKTRLAEEFLAHTQSKGAVAITARCYEGETDLAYGPIVDGLSAALNQPGRLSQLQDLPAHWLVEAARLLPDLNSLLAARSSELISMLPSEGPGAQSRFFEGLRQVLLRIFAPPPPGILFLDDLHWADTASIEFLTYLVRRLRGYPMFILATWQNESFSRDHRLVHLAAEIQRAGTGQLLRLPRLGPRDIDELVSSVNYPQVNLAKEFSHRLYQQTDGLPFFAVEYLESMVHGINLTAGEDWEIPHTVRELLHSRLATISETSWQLLTTAAVIGHSFDFSTLHEASGRSEIETITGLEELLDRGLIQEKATGGNAAQIHYDFTYDMLRTLVYEETSLTRRRLLHRRVAEALSGQPGSLASQIAHHYRMAGQDIQAAEYYKMAGEHDRKLYANVQAVTHFQAAMAAGHPATAEIHEAIGDSHTLLGEYSAAITSYEAAAALSDPVDLPRLEHKLGDLHHRQGEWELAESFYQAALNALGESSNPGERSRIYADWSQTAHRQDQFHRAAALADKALELAETAGEASALARAHNILGILARGEKNLDQARIHFLSGLEIAETENNPFARIAALNNLALVYAEQGDLEQSITCAQAALDLSILLGDRHHEAALHNNLADLYHEAGQSEKAMEHLKKAVIIFAEIGINAGSMQPEIWKLTEW